jgi:hypothetical protein
MEKSLFCRSDFFNGFSFGDGRDRTTFLTSILIYYTDGSRKDGMTGMGIYGPSVRYYEVLSESTTKLTLCMEESDTAQHIMCECQAVARIRLEKAL